MFLEFDRLFCSLRSIRNLSIINVWNRSNGSAGLSFAVNSDHTLHKVTSPMNSVSILKFGMKPKKLPLLKIMDGEQKIPAVWGMSPYPMERTQCQTVIGSEESGR